jgi:predicted transcriptional regulator
MNGEKILRVSDAMTIKVRAIDAMATVADAIAAMRAARVSSLVVERRDDADEFGLLLISDVASQVIAKNRAVDRVNVYEIMTKPVLSLPAEMQVKYAVRMLVQFNLSRALVVDDRRKPVGIVTLRDLVLSYAGDSETP